MATASKIPAEGNVVPHKGDHDRVAMLSVRADGTLDQHQPEIIGDKGFAESATREQFRQQAVSAVDVAERGASTSTDVVDAPQDPSVAALKEKHDAAAEAAEKAADKTVGSLFQD